MIKAGLKPEEIAKEIVEDHVSGAAQLAIKAANMFLKLVSEKTDIKAVRKLAKILAESRPSMPPIANISYVILKLIEEHISEGENLRDAVELAVRSAVKTYQDNLKKTVQNASKILRKYDSIITHSYSSTAAAAIELCSKLKVFVTESRPGYEGRRLAKRLAQKGLDVTLIVDSAASYVIDRGLVDAFVTGCDAILDDCSIVNKIGTKMIALTAGEAGIPFIVVTDTWKTAVHGFSFEEHSPSEVYDKLAGTLTALNPYFEIVPARLVTFYVTEDGRLDREKLSERLKELWKKITTGEKNVQKIIQHHKHACNSGKLMNKD